MNDTHVQDPWALFVDDRPFARDVEPVDKAPRPAPDIRVELHSTDEQRASWLVAGVTLCAVALLVGGLLAAGVHSAAAAGAWMLVVACAAAGTVFALWTRVTRRAAVFALDPRGIARHMAGPERRSDVTLIPWDEVAFYRDSESTEHAALLAVGRGGARIRLHQANPSAATYAFIREFVAYAEHRSPLEAATPLQDAANRLGVLGTGTLMVVAWIVLGRLSPEIREVGTGVLLLLVFLAHSYAVLTDDDRAHEDLRSHAWDARLRAAVRRALGIRSE